jgi:hypothetical protein
MKRAHDQSGRTCIELCADLWQVVAQQLAGAWEALVTLMSVSHAMLVWLRPALPALMLPRWNATLVHYFGRCHGRRRPSRRYLAQQCEPALLLALGRAYRLLQTVPEPLDWADDHSATMRYGDSLLPARSFWLLCDTYIRTPRGFEPLAEQVQVSTVGSYLGNRTWPLLGQVLWKGKSLDDVEGLANNIWVQRGSYASATKIRFLETEMERRHLRDQLRALWPNELGRGKSGTGFDKRQRRHRATGTNGS